MELARDSFSSCQILWLDLNVEFDGIGRMDGDVVEYMGSVEEEVITDDDAVFSRDLAAGMNFNMFEHHVYGLKVNERN
ncbi:hypothetical protein AAC387_Pa02g3848 [Persea americana]